MDVNFDAVADRLCEKNHLSSRPMQYAYRLCENSLLCHPERRRRVQKLEFMLKPATLEKDKGIPILAEHQFVFDSNSDSFNWKLVLEGYDEHLLSKGISNDNLIKLQKSIVIALEERKSFIDGLDKKNRTLVNSDILKFEVNH